MNTEQKIVIGNVFDKLKELKDNSVHCVVTSPPYHQLRNYTKEKELIPHEIGREATLEEYVASLVSVFQEVRRVLHPSGTLWLDLGNAWVDGQYTAMPWKVALALQADGWILKQPIIWAKGISGEACNYGWSGRVMPEGCKSRVTNSYDYVFLFAKQEGYFFDPVNARESVLLKGQKVPSERNMRSVWTIGLQQYLGAHTAIFPEALVDKIIKIATSERGCCSACGAQIKRKIEVVGKEVTQAMKVAGCDTGGFYTGDPTKDYHPTKAQNPADSKRSILASMAKVKKYSWVAGCTCWKDAAPCVVLDPFAGSFTTLAVAKKLGRSAIGIELNPEYEKLGLDRLSQAVEGAPINSEEVSPLPPSGQDSDNEKTKKIIQYLLNQDGTLAPEIIQVIDDEFWSLL